jgi:hypothetical protein
MFEPGEKALIFFFLQLLDAEDESIKSENWQSVTTQAALHVWSHVFLRTSFCVTNYTHILVTNMWRKLR